MGVILIYLAFAVFMVAACWRVCTKAGQPGWSVLIPIFNLVVMLRIIKKPWWWLFLMMIPLVNIIILIIYSLELAKVFGKGTGFGVGLMLLSPIFYPILAFGDAKYMHGENIAGIGTLDEGMLK